LTDASLGPGDVVAYWRSAGPDKWFKKDEAFDREISERFSALHAEAAAGRKDSWAGNAEGALALILVLDQFSRNIFRGRPQAFAQDDKARAIADAALAAGFDREAPPELRSFFYLPLMHSESIFDQERCVALCHGLPERGTLPYARDHEKIIRRFGRFPHRNLILGRHTTPAERLFLEGGGFAG
jgi:uncharacterized protein (DUF924 family)